MNAEQTLRGIAALAGITVSLIVPAAWSADHNNLDAGRPLRFEDADAIAYGEQNLEVGLSLVSPKGGGPGVGFQLEYLYGFAPNSHLSIDTHASAGGRAGSDDTRFDSDEVGIGLFHNFNREYDNTPAISVRGDVTFPTGRGGGWPEYRIRGIMSKVARQYDRFHLNLDANFKPGADAGEREFRPAVTLGYSRPLGYPTRFNRTGLAEVSLRQGERKGQGPILSVGAGFREQVGVNAVLDAGLQADVAAWKGAPRENVRLVVGYSTAF